MATHINEVDGSYQRTSYGPKLTDLQVRIIAEISSGRSMREVARKLHYSYDHVFHQLRAARESLGASSMAHACVIALHRGYISCPTGSDLRSFPVIR